MNLLWVTSFAADMYKASGSELLKSFAITGTEGHLLVCHEGLGDRWQPQYANMTWQALDEDPFLRSWLEENEDIIPPHLGGKNSGACTCPLGPFAEDAKGHEPPCICHWMNRNASRWFRKIVALDIARSFRKTSPKVKKEAFDAIIWIDSDCLFTKKVTKKIVKKWFGEDSMFYLKNRRPVLEAGVVGYFLTRHGRKMVDALVAEYASGAFRSLSRWDDSYVIQKVLLELAGRDPKFTAVDLATKVGDRNVVAEYSPLAPYLKHFKGKHNRSPVDGVMK